MMGKNKVDIINTDDEATLETIHDRDVTTTDVVTSNEEESPLVDVTYTESLQVVEDLAPNRKIIVSDEKLTADSTEIISTNNNVKKTDFTSLFQVSHDHEDLPEYIKLLQDGTGACGDCRYVHAKPEWLDMERFRRGQEFQKKYSFGLMFSQLISLMILFVFQGALEPLIYTGKSDTPFKAFKRYLSTALRVRTWYEGDVWKEDDVAYKNIKIVRTMHEYIRKRLTHASKEELAKKVTLDDLEGITPMWTTLHPDLSEDFKLSCPVLKSALHGEKQVYVNQTDMAVTQFGFFGLVLLFPKMFGIHKATVEDLDGLAHYWRTIGYLLGIEDKYNLCNGSLEVVTKRCQDLLELWIKPSFGKITRDWIHMSRCMVEGISYYVVGVSFEFALLYLCEIMSIKAPKLAASMTFVQRFLYSYAVFVFKYVLRVPGMWSFHNWAINLCIKRAQSLSQSPQRMRKLEEKVYPYQSQARMVCTKA